MGCVSTKQQDQDTTSSNSSRDSRRLDRRVMRARVYRHECTVVPNDLPEVDLSRYVFATSDKTKLLQHADGVGSNAGAPPAVTQVVSLCVACGHKHKFAAGDAARTAACDRADEYHSISSGASPDESAEEGAAPSFPCSAAQ